MIAADQKSLEALKRGPRSRHRPPVLVGGYAHRVREQRSRLCRRSHGRSVQRILIHSSIFSSLFRLYDQLARTVRTKSLTVLSGDHPRQGAGRRECSGVRTGYCTAGVAGFASARSDGATGAVGAGDNGTVLWPAAASFC